MVATDKVWCPLGAVEKLGCRLHYSLDCKRGRAFSLLEKASPFPDPRRGGWEVLNKTAVLTASADDGGGWEGGVMRS